MTKEDRHQRAAKHFGKDGGHVTMTECEICGHLEWQSTATKEPDGFTVVPGNRPCARCSDVFYRAPEIASWVLAVVSKSKEPPC